MNKRIRKKHARLLSELSSLKRARIYAELRDSTGKLIAILKPEEGRNLFHFTPTCPLPFFIPKLTETSFSVLENGDKEKDEEC